MATVTTEIRGDETAVPRQRADAPAADLSLLGGLARWERRYAQGLVVVDCLAIYVALLTALVLRFGLEADYGDVYGFKYGVVSGALGLAWLLSLGGARAYEPRLLGTGADEYRRLFLASFRVGGAVAITSYAFRLELARGFVAIALPLGTVLLLCGRYATRRLLHRGRSRGRFSHRVVVVGDPQHVTDLVRQLRRAPYAGLSVIGACLPDAAGGLAAAGLDVDGETVPVLGTLATVPEALLTAEADTVAVTAAAEMTSTALRRLGWQLENSGVDLLVAPALTDVAGPRISIRPVAGLPLLHVEKPALSGFWHGVRGIVYWLVSVLLLIALSPLLAAIALAIKLDDGGPVIFTQTRVGLGGREFRVYKFRTMVVDAEARLAELRARNDGDGLLFKLRDDPRITRVGRWLRKCSLDELPQLVNVIRGDMALVGPRPPLPDEVEQYGSDVRRRLLIKPGITGLWQVSGRSDLTWEESVRLDLYYVENWSPALDLVILWRTVFAVVRGSGAY